MIGSYLLKMNIPWYDWLIFWRYFKLRTDDFPPPGYHISFCENGVGGTFLVLCNTLNHADGFLWRWALLSCFENESLQKDYDKDIFLNFWCPYVTLICTNAFGTTICINSALSSLFPSPSHLPGGVGWTENCISIYGSVTTGNTKRVFYFFAHDHAVFLPWCTCAASKFASSCIWPVAFFVCSHF